MQRYEAGERDFRGQDLAHINLAGANLQGICVDGASLAGASLRRANLSHASMARTELVAADLEGANLTQTGLQDANLARARLHAANLRRASLLGANLYAADLRTANLTEASLSNTCLMSTDMRFANLTSARLEAANLAHARLADATCDFVILGRTCLLGVELGPLCRSNARHVDPSMVDHVSIVRSVREPKLKEFLRATGMPEVFVEYMVDSARSLDSGGIFSLLQSTYIIYGGPDEPFARKLNAALQKQGVSTFFFPEHAVPGHKLHRLMRSGVNERDKVILICSRNSLERPGVLNELEETLAREARDGGNAYLIPVRLDDYVLKHWVPPAGKEDLVTAVTDRVVSDFSQHEDEQQFRTELGKLVSALKRKRNELSR